MRGFEDVHDKEKIVTCDCELDMIKVEKSVIGSTQHLVLKEVLEIHHRWRLHEGCVGDAAKQRKAPTIMNCFPKVVLRSKEVKKRGIGGE